MPSDLRNTLRARIVHVAYTCHGQPTRAAPRTPAPAPAHTRTPAHAHADRKRYAFATPACRSRCSLGPGRALRNRPWSTRTTHLVPHQMPTPAVDWLVCGLSQHQSVLLGRVLLIGKLCCGNGCTHRPDRLWPPQLWGGLRLPASEASHNPHVGFHLSGVFRPEGTAGGGRRTPECPSAPAGPFTQPWLPHSGPAFPLTDCSRTTIPGFWESRFLTVSPFDSPAYGALDKFEMA